MQMQKIAVKKYAALLIFVTVLYALCPVYGLENQAVLSRGQAADIIACASDDYGGTGKAVMMGYEDGSLKSDEPVTRAEALIMISRAFGALPQPVGNDSRIYLQGVTYADIPSWAVPDITNLTAAGVVLPDDDSLLHSDEYATEDWIMSVIRRIWALLGSNPRDDFYASVNKDYLDASELSSGSTSSGTFSRLSGINNGRVAKAIREISSQNWEKGSAEQKIKDFYLNAVNVEMRNKEGIKPMDKYLQQIDSAKSMEDILKVRQTVLTETGSHLLLSFDLTADTRDSNKYALVMSCVTPNMPADVYEDADSIKAYTSYITRLLELTGSTSTEATKEAQQYISFEKDLAQSMLNVWEYSDVDKTSNLLTMEELNILLPAVDAGELIKGSGFTIPDKVIVYDKDLLTKFSTYLNGDSLDMLKLCCRLDMAVTFGSTLSSDFDEAKDTFYSEYYGISGNKSAEDKAVVMLQSAMPLYAGKLYADRYFSPKAKADVEGIVRELIDTYKQRIDKLSWMSDLTKERAVKKLDSMTVKIGYPKSWSSPADDANIRSYAEGGSLFENVCEIMKSNNSYTTSMQHKPADKDMWAMGVYAVNAYYNPSANEIVFPAGILQAPFYDIKASAEENMGGIGFIIAHEITHSFDNNGAKFDETGNASDWWEDEDYDKFSKLCKKAEEFFDGIESAPGIDNDGRLTLSENIADLGSMACIIDVLGPDADYKMLFEHMASCWLSSSTHEYLEYLSHTDVHSPAKLRVNRILVNFPEFYEAYDIKPGDGMYVPPEERICIW